MSEDEDILCQAEQRIGTVLHGKYRLDAVLGVGGMAVVYAATHRNQKRFAVKMLHPELSIRSELRTRFLREGYAANSVQHDGVVAVLDDDVDETGAAFLVMELLHGEDVQALCSRWGGKLPVQAALDVTDQLLGVLAAAHERAIVHRDIKPANLFVTRDGQLKVLDFGIARLKDVTANLQSTHAGAVLGTPAFMAPEQAAAQGSEIDARADLWAVGATLFALLSGQLVHEGENGRQVLIRAATLPARSLLSAAPQLPLSVVDVVTKALMFDKAARWESAEAMRAALARVRRELFGESSSGSLKALLAVDEGRLRREAGSAALATGVAVTFAHKETTAATVPLRVPSVERGPLTTTAKPVAAAGARHSQSALQRRATFVVAVAAALLGSGLVVARALRPTESLATLPSAATTSLASTPVAATLGMPLATIPSASANAASVPESETARPASASRATTPAGATTTDPSPPRSSLALTAQASSGLGRSAAAVRQIPANNASRDPASASRPSNSAASASAAPANPLQIDLQ